MGPTFSIASLLVEDVGYDRFALPGLNAVIGDPKASLNTISLAQKKIPTCLFAHVLIVYYRAEIYQKREYLSCDFLPKKEKHKAHCTPRIHSQGVGVL